MYSSSLNRRRLSSEAAMGVGVLLCVAPLVAQTDPKFNRQ